MGVLEELAKQDQQPTTVLDALAQSPVTVKAHTRKPRARVGAAVGGGAGAVLGSFTPAGPVAGATIGGSIGEQAQQGMELGIPTQTPFGTIDPGALGLVTGELPNPEQTLQQGSTQGLMEAGGRVVGGAVTKTAHMAGKQLMSKALSPAKALVKNFPTVVEDALRQGATVNRWMGKGGMQAAEKVRKSATDSVIGLLRSATQRGESVDIRQVAQPVIAAVEKKAGKLSALETEQLTQAVEKRADELLLKSVLGATQRSSKNMSPMMADELRKAAARAARSTLNQEAVHGVPLTALPDLDRLITKGAGEAVKGLRGVRAARATEQTAIGVERAVREAEMRPMGASVGVGVGPLKAGVAVPPGVASRLALLSGLFGSTLIGPSLSNLLRTGQLGVQAASE